MSRPDMAQYSPEAIAILPAALEHAHRLGHRYLGAEHLLLAVASADHPAGAVLRDHGVTPERVEQQARAGLFGGLDQEALASIGIDLDTVRARIESSFGPDALARAGQAGPRRPRPAISTWLIRRWHRRRVAAGAPIPLRAAPGLWRRDRGAPVFVPFAPGTQQSLLNVRRAARAQHDPAPGVEHVALVLIGMTDGPVPAILSSLGVPPLVLRTALLNRYPRAN